MPIMMQLNLIQNIAIWALPVLFAITVHEVAHGWVASKLGDKTAQHLGRITLNPLKHIDLIGTVLVPLGLLLFNSRILFGWAKPVPINSNNLYRPRRDMAFVAAAGPLSNFIMAIIWAAIMKLGLVLVQSGIGYAIPIAYMGYAGININLILMVLNLIPIPPLDGSRVLSSLLPGRLAYKYDQIAPYGFFILVLLLMTGVLNFVLGPSIGFFVYIFNLVFGLGM